MKKPNIRLTGKTKKIVISVSALAAAAAIAVGILFGVRGGAEPVGVYPFSAVGMTEFKGEGGLSPGRKWSQPPNCILRIYYSGIFRIWQGFPGNLRNL